MVWDEQRWQRWLQGLKFGQQAPAAIEEETRMLAGQPGIMPQAAELADDMAKAEHWEEPIPVSPSAQQYGQAKRFTGVNQPLETFLQCRSPIPCLWRVTVSLDLPSVGDPPPFVDQGRSFAVVRFGAGGAQHFLIMDWGRGQTVAVPGDFVEVAGQLLVVNAPAFSENPINMYATAVPHVNAAPSTPPIRTINFGSIGAGASSGFNQLPPFTKQVYIVAEAGAASGNVWEVEFVGDGGAAVLTRWTYQASSTRSLPNFGLPIPVPGFASAVALTNNSGTSNATGVQLICELQV